MKKLVITLIVLFLGITTLAQIFAFTPQTDLEVMEWAVYSADRQAVISYADGEGYKWMTIYSRGVTYRVYLTMQEGQWAAEGDGWNLMMDAITDGYITNDNELSLTLTPASTEIASATPAAETYLELCGLESVEIVSDMTIHVNRSPYTDYTYRFFDEPQLGWQVFIYEGGELEGSYTLATLPTVPFDWSLSGGGTLILTGRC